MFLDSSENSRWIRWVDPLKRPIPDIEVRDSQGSILAASARTKGPVVGPFHWDSSERLEVRANGLPVADLQPESLARHDVVDVSPIATGRIRVRSVHPEKLDLRCSLIRQDANPTLVAVGKPNPGDHSYDFDWLPVGQFSISPVIGWDCERRVRGLLVSVTSGETAWVTEVELGDLSTPSSTGTVECVGCEPADLLITPAYADRFIDTLPVWHLSTQVRSDGSFELGELPGRPDWSIVSLVTATNSAVVGAAPFDAHAIQVRCATLEIMVRGVPKGSSVVATPHSESFPESMFRESRRRTGSGMLVFESIPATITQLEIRGNNRVRTLGDLAMQPGLTTTVEVDLN